AVKYRKNKATFHVSPSVGASPPLAPLGALTRYTRMPVTGENSVDRQAGRAPRRAAKAQAAGKAKAMLMRGAASTARSATAKSERGWHGNPQEAADRPHCRAFQRCMVRNGYSLMGSWVDPDRVIAPFAVYQASLLTEVLLKLAAVHSTTSRCSSQAPGGASLRSVSRRSVSIRRIASRRFWRHSSSVSPSPTAGISRQ